MKKFERIIICAYKAGLISAWASLFITAISLVSMLVLPGVDFLKWFFEEIVCWIFAGGFLMLMVSRIAEQRLVERPAKNGVSFNEKE